MGNNSGVFIPNKVQRDWKKSNKKATMSRIWINFIFFCVVGIKRGNTTDRNSKIKAVENMSSYIKN